MAGLLIRYDRHSTDQQDLTAHRDGLDGWVLPPTVSTSTTD